MTPVAHHASGMDVGGTLNSASSFAILPGAAYTRRYADPPHCRTASRARWCNPTHVIFLLDTARRTRDLSAVPRRSAPYRQAVRSAAEIVRGHSGYARGVVSWRVRGRFPIVAWLLVVGLIFLGGLLAMRALGDPGGADSSKSRGSKVVVRRVTRPAEPVTSSGPLPGALLIADRGNNRILLVDASHRVLWRFPTARDRAVGVHLNFDDDSFVEPGGKAIVSNEEEAHTIVSINIRTHARVHLYGTPGVPGSGPNELNTPDDAYVLPDGTLTVADAYNCRILFIRAHRVVRQLGRTGSCYHDPPRAFGAVNGDTPLRDGGVLVSEIPGAWIDNLARNGRLRWAVRAPVSYPSDPQPLPGGRILLADYASPGAAIIMNRKGHVLWRYGPAAGWGALDHPSLAVMLPNGDIAINDDYHDRVVIVDPRQNAIVWQYGHLDRPGTGFNSLKTPDGMDFVPLGKRESPLWALVHHP